MNQNLFFDAMEYIDDEMVYRVGSKDDALK